MTGQDIEQTREDIKDKARGFLIRQVEVVIRTVPSTKYPKGARYSGYIFDVLDNKIILNDTYVMKRFEIFISELASAADIYEKEVSYESKKTNTST